MIFSSLLYVLVSASLAAEPAAAPASSAAPTIKVGAYTFTIGGGVASLPKGFAAEQASPGQESLACEAGQDNPLCAVLRDGKVIAVMRLHQGTDGTYGCDTSPVFQRNALPLFEAAGVTNAKQLFGQAGLEGGTYDEETSQNKRRIAGKIWTVDITVYLDSDSIPVNCAVRTYPTGTKGASGK